MFVFGPVLVGVFAVVFGAWAPIVAAAGLTILFVTAFAVHPTGRVGERLESGVATRDPVSELTRPALLIVIAGVLSVGMVFGTTLTALTALMQARGEAEAAGLYYGVMGVGSAILAMSVAFFSPRFTLRFRWLCFAGIAALGAAVFAVVQSLAAVIVGLAVVGVGLGPLLVTLYGFGAGRSPQGRSVTVMAMLGSGITLGQALAMAVTGYVGEHWGSGAAFLLPLGAALLALIAGLVNLALTPSQTR